MFASANFGFFAGGSGPVADFSGSDVTAYRAGALASSCSLFFNADGSFGSSYSGDIGGGPSGNWYRPSQSGIGAGYYIRATLQSGQTPSSGGTGTWDSLTAGKTYTYNSGTGGSVSSRRGTVLFEISPNVSGTPVVGSGTFSFTAERES
jgi:hypothetical protein